ncbi:MAG: DUF6460 domain-containing protein [Beijerinckiaceae bacterium]
MSAPEFPRHPAFDGTTIPPQPAAAEPSRPVSPLQRFLGGPPLAVFLRLLFVSLVVGALLVWLHIHPYDVFFWIQRFFNRLWMLGWDAVREVVEYVLAGAVIVVPVWLVMRIINARPAR